MTGGFHCVRGGGRFPKIGRERRRAVFLVTTFAALSHGLLDALTNGGFGVAFFAPLSSLTKKIRTMPTDPARVRRDDPGDPEKCPVWSLHKIYSNAETRDWVVKGCTTAGIGCLECKQPLIDAVLAEQEPIRERAQRYLDQPQLLRDIVDAGCDKARAVAQETMRDVRQAMGLSYR